MHPACICPSPLFFIPAMHPADICTSQLFFIPAINSTCICASQLLFTVVMHHTCTCALQLLFTLAMDSTCICALQLFITTAKLSPCICASLSIFNYATASIYLTTLALCVFTSKLLLPKPCMKLASVLHPRPTCNMHLCFTPEMQVSPICVSPQSCM